MMKEIGSCEAIVYGVRTTVDGSLRVTLDILPTNEKLSSELLKLAVSADKGVFVGFAKDE